MSYDPHEKKSHFLLIMVFISVLAKKYAHFSLEIYIFKDELRHALPFLHFFHIKLRWSPVLIQTTTLFFVQKYKSWIVCPENSWKATRGGARQVIE